jgi:glycosyltransferase involved in cell wall biosynthesis
MNSQKRSISVLVPAYNAEHYLEECLDSLIAQSCNDWECLCMNDGSSDHTWQIMQSYAGKEPRIKIYTQENKGVTQTLNTLLDKARGDYLFYLDSDDYIHPQTFEVLSYLIEKHDLDVIECDIQRVSYQEPQPSWDTFDPTAMEVEHVPDLLVYLPRSNKDTNWINKVNKLYRFEKIKELRFSEQLSYEEDYFYATQLNTIIQAKAIVHKPFYFYRFNPTSQTQQVNFERYTNAAIARIGLSYDYFILQNRVPLTYRDVFMSDLAKDAFRMIVRKSMRKCKDAKLRKKLFKKASRSMDEYVAREVVRTKDLKWIERHILWCCIRHWYGATRLLVFLT